MNNLKPVPVTMLSVNDLEAQGFDVSKVTQEQIEWIASKMADNYVENLFWDDINCYAKKFNIPKI